MKPEQQLNVTDIVRAWKDEAYAESLSVEQRDALPRNPAGELELTDTEADLVAGGGDRTLVSVYIPESWDPVCSTMASTCNSCPPPIQV